MPPAANSLLKRVEQLRAGVRRRSPQQVAQLIGARFIAGANGEDTLLLRYWGVEVVIATPQLEARDAASGRPLDALAQAMLAYYLHESDGASLAHRWIAFSQLPDGIFYAASYQGYTGQTLLRHFGRESDRFVLAARAAGGEPAEFADVSFAFRALPRVELLAACWLGDEDFPPSYRILFDAHAFHHIPSEGCAILGSLLTKMILRHDSPGADPPTNEVSRLSRSQ